jgi:MFS transporter, DHA1 family, multidrug resistance protein
LTDWKRNLTFAWISQLLCILGFSSIFSFMPYYIQELGVTDPDQVKLWTGWITTGGSLSMAIMAPIWGVLADRYGRKIMVERAAFVGALMLLLMSFATSPSQVLVLRTIQGIFTGTITAFTTLVSSSTPRGKEGFSLGLMQVAVYSGLTGGPFIGGLLADTFGYRTTFIVSSGTLLLGGLLAWRFLEDRFQPSESKRPSILANAKEMVANKTVLTMVGLIMGLYFVSTMVRPILPIFIQEIEPSNARLATTTGMITGANALAAAIAAAIAGKLADRFGHRRVLVIAALCTAAAHVPIAFAQSSTQVLWLYLIMGLFTGGLAPSANALIALNVKPENQGATYGLSASLGSVGRAMAPPIGSFIAVSWGSRALFPIGAALYGLIALFVRINVSASHSDMVPAEET